MILRRCRLCHMRHYGSAPSISWSRRRLWRPVGLVGLAIGLGGLAPASGRLRPSSSWRRAPRRGVRGFRLPGLAAAAVCSSATASSSRPRRNRAQPRLSRYAALSGSASTAGGPSPAPARDAALVGPKVAQVVHRRDVVGKLVEHLFEPLFGLGGRPSITCRLASTSRASRRISRTPGVA